MDIEKERTMFESTMKGSLGSLIDLTARDGLKGFSYFDWSTQCAWIAWQAAKASAVPDGFKVAPINYECAWCGCTELGGFNDEAMIEQVSLGNATAQEN